MTGVEHYAMYGNPFEKSLCHAWSASPIYLLGNFRLGVENTGIAYDTFDVRPNPGDLKGFHGKVPVPGGAFLSPWIRRKSGFILNPLCGRNALCGGESLYAKGEERKTMSREKKMRRLNRTIAKITMLGYSAVLVILFLLDCYMIQAHQEKLKAAKWELLNDYTEQVKNSIDKVDQLMYDIYSNDKEFPGLAEEQSSAKEYSTVYAGKTAAPADHHAGLSQQLLHFLWKWRKMLVWYAGQIFGFCLFPGSKKGAGTISGQRFPGKKLVN